MDAHAHGFDDKEDFGEGELNCDVTDSLLI